MSCYRGNIIRLAAFGLVCFGLSSQGSAAVSSTGTFLTDADMFQIEFGLTFAGTVNIRSFGYGGGMNAMGAMIPQGGFATDIAVFDAGGSQDLVDQDSLGGTAPSACSVRQINTDTGLCLDAFLSLHLTAGDYIVTLTEQGNPALGPTLGDGFAEAGMGNFTGGPFLDPFGNQMNGNWAFDINGEGVIPITTATPEPSTDVLALIFMSGLVIIARRRHLKLKPARISAA